MHPSYKSDKPGIALTAECSLNQSMPRTSRTIRHYFPGAIARWAVSIDGPTQRLLGIRLATVERGSATHIVRVVGV